MCPLGRKHKTSHGLQPLSDVGSVQSFTEETLSLMCLLSAGEEVIHSGKPNLIAMLTLKVSPDFFQVYK